MAMLFMWVFFTGAGLSVSLVASILAGLSQVNFFGSWVCLELNMLLFVALMSATEKSVSSASMKYFITQSLGSSLFLWAVGLKSLGAGATSEVIMSGALSFKLGIAPFHVWFVSVLSQLSWELVFVASTLQKVLPVFLLSAVKLEFLILFMGLSVFVSVLGSMNQSFLKKILAYSSIFMTIWLMVCEGELSKSLEYLVAYSNALGVIVVLFSTMALEEMGEALSGMSGAFNSMMVSGFLSMSGCPPFVGFYAKIVVVASLLSHGHYASMLILVMASVFLLYIYMRVFYFNLSADGGAVTTYRLSRGSTSLVLGLGILLVFSGFLCLGVVHSKLWTFSV